MKGGDVTEQEPEKTGRRRLTPAQRAHEAVRAEAGKIERADARVEKAQVALGEAKSEREAIAARLRYLLQNPDLDPGTRGQFEQAYLGQGGALPVGSSTGLPPHTI